MSKRNVPAICAGCKKPFLTTQPQLAAGRGRYCSQSCAKTVDITGLVFGFLTVVERAGVDQTFVTWRVRCACGTEKTVSGSKLRSGSVKSCGCKRDQMIGEANTTHGMKHTGTWRSWMAMRRRCHWEKDPSYARYGGRGIKVCDRWQSFENFLEDMGERPRGTTIDRFPNRDGNYEPGNCRWATDSEQSQNKDSARMISHLGETLPLVEWAKRTGISTRAIAARIDAGWSISDALTRPSQRRRTLIA